MTLGLRRDGASCWPADAYMATRNRSSRRRKQPLTRGRQVPWPESLLLDEPMRQLRQKSRCNGFPLSRCNIERGRPVVVKREGR